MPKKEQRGAEATSQNNCTKAKKKTQEDVVLEYLREHGTLTTLEMVAKLYIMNPQMRIKNLRARGHVIDTEYATLANGKRYGVYILRED